MLAKLLEGLGIWSAHIENVYGADGLPDRYLGRGLWIECKAIVFTRKSAAGRPKRMATLLRKSQKRTIPKLIEAGDTVLVCLFVHTEDEPTRFVIVSYEEFLNLTELVVDGIAVPWGLSNPLAIQEIKNELGRSGFPIPNR